jgi:hypothetical protein
MASPRTQLLGIYLELRGSYHDPCIEKPRVKTHKKMQEVCSVCCYLDSFR